MDFFMLIVNTLIGDMINTILLAYYQVINFVYSHADIHTHQT